MEINDEFEQYIRATEPGPKERAQLWQTARSSQEIEAGSQKRPELVLNMLEYNQSNTTERRLGCGVLWSM